MAAEIIDLSPWQGRTPHKNTTMFAPRKGEHSCWLAGRGLPTPHIYFYHFMVSCC